MSHICPISRTAAIALQRLLRCALELGGGRLGRGQVLAHLVDGLQVSGNRERGVERKRDGEREGWKEREMERKRDREKNAHGKRQSERERERMLKKGISREIMNDM